MSLLAELMGNRWSIFYKYATPIGVEAADISTLTSSDRNGIFIAIDYETDKKLHWERHI